jgi:hypothetical protein
MHTRDIAEYVQAAEAGAKNSVIFPPNKSGPDPAAITESDSAASSSADNCGRCPVEMSRNCTVQEKERESVCVSMCVSTMYIHYTHAHMYIK